MKRVLLGVGVVSALALAACTNGGNPTAAEPRSFPSPDAQSVRPNSIERVVEENERFLLVEKFVAVEEAIEADPRSHEPGTG